MVPATRSGSARDRGTAQGASPFGVSPELRAVLDKAADQVAIGSEHLLKGVRRLVDAALYHLRAWQTFRDPATRRWAQDARASVLDGSADPALESDELREALEERRRRLSN
jgi:hypothetical protein